jgi:calreticulin
VKAGSIFDNILLTDDFATAKKFAEDTWGKLKEGEKKMFDTVSEVRGDCWCCRDYAVWGQ